MHNYFGRQVGDAVVRQLAMGRDLERFIDDVGQEPMTPEQAYEVARSGGERVVVRRASMFGGRRWLGVEWVMPAVGVDCLEAINRGCAEAGAIERDWQQDFANQFDSWDSGWQDFGPMDSVHAAHAEAEWEVSRQKWDAWDLHDTGFVAEDDLPVFLRRASAVEDAMDMRERIRRAEAELEMRFIVRITNALSGRT